MKYIRNVQITLGAFLLGMVAQWFLALDVTPNNIHTESVAAEEVPVAEATGQYIVHNGLGDIEVVRTHDGVFIPLPESNTAWWDETWPPFVPSPGQTGLQLKIQNEENW
jgi:hypothetical protein